MPRILWIMDDFYPVTGAPAIRIHSFLNELRDYHSEVLGGLTGREFPVNPSFVFHHLTRPPETSPCRFIWFLAKLPFIALYLVVRHRPQFVVISVPKYECLTALFAVRPFCQKVVLDLRDSFQFLDYVSYLKNFLPTFVARPLGTFIKTILRALVFQSTKLADCLTVANEGISQQLRSDFNVDHCRIHVVPNGVDPELFKPQEQTAVSPIRLVYLGNFAEKDDFSWLREFARELRELKIVVHLIGDGRRRESVIKELREAGVDFHYEGVVAHEFLPELLGKMHVGFIFRSSFAAESIPVAIYEFCSMNLPTLTNRVGIMADFVEEHKLGECLANGAEFLDVMRRWAKDPSIFSSYQTLHDLAVQKFSRQAAAKLFRRVLEGLHAAS